MKNILTIFMREVKAYFNSAIAYIFIVVFLLMSVGIFMTDFFLISIADMRRFFLSLPIILCVFLPAVSMRLWAEDRRGNTLELLLTFPVKTHELVLGKFLASFVFYLTALASTLPVPIMLIALGAPDIGVIICQYIGAALLGGFFLSLGIFISGFCKDQIVSFIIAMMACFCFFIIGTEFAVGSIDGWIPGFGSFLRGALGMSHHFSTFQKGVMDVRDVLYFVVGSAVFLVLNGFWLETRLRPRAKTFFTTTALIAAGIFVLINFIFSDLSIARHDFTQDKIYTISKATEKILQGLDAPITLKLFISPIDKMPSGMKTTEQDIRDKLEEFKVSSKGNFNYKVFHMEAANIAAEEDEYSLERSMERKGLHPFQVRSVEADEVGVKLIYSSISLAYREKAEEIIPQITPQNLPDLEYIILSKIFKMTLDGPAHIALVAPYIERVIDPQMKAILQQLGQNMVEKYRDDEYELASKLLEYEGYEISRIRLTKDEPIPEDTDTLVVIEPKELNERQRFEINKFLVSGGSVFLAVQNYDFNYQTVGLTGLQVSARDKKPQINQLLKSWGLEVNKKFLMDEQSDVITLTGGRRIGIFSVASPIKLPMQIKITDEQMNKDISITSHVPVMLYLWGTAITLDREKLKDANLEVQVLITSSADAWELNYHADNLSAQEFEPVAVEERKKFPLAVMIQGQFSNTFAGKEVPEWPKPEWPKEEVKADQESYEAPEEKAELDLKPGKLILVGCARMFNKELFNRGGQMPFFLNSIDVLTLGEELVQVRSKQPMNRSLKRISIGARASWKLFATFLVPCLLCVIGALRIFVRKRSKWTYLRTI